MDVNSLGQVAGWSNTSDGWLRAFRYSGSTLSDLKTLGGGLSRANGINDAGQVVGASYVRNLGDAYHAFIWQNGKMTDLNNELPRGSARTLEVAYDINNAGRIVGTTLVNGQRHAFMLSPGGAAPLTSSAAPATTTLTTSAALVPSPASESAEPTLLNSGSAIDGVLA
jgi:probable HAF family extracellular repeat protein